MDGDYQYVHRLAYALKAVIENVRPFSSEAEYSIHKMLSNFYRIADCDRSSVMEFIANYCTEKYNKWVGSGSVRNPEFSVDHINRDFFNSTVENLRLATKEEQSENKEKYEALRTKVIISSLV